MSFTFPYKWIFPIDNILYSKINYVFRSGGYVRTDEEHAMVEEISEHPLIKGKNTALSRRAATSV